MINKGLMQNIIILIIIFAVIIIIAMPGESPKFEIVSTTSTINKDFGWTEITIIAENTGTKTGHDVFCNVLIKNSDGTVIDVARASFGNSFDPGDQRESTVSLKNLPKHGYETIDFQFVWH